MRTITCQSCQTTTLGTTECDGRLSNCCKSVIHKVYFHEQKNVAFVCVTQHEYLACLQLVCLTKLITAFMKRAAPSRRGGWADGRRVTLGLYQVYIRVSL